MTETAHEAGVELDRRVAEKIFGVHAKVPSSVGHRSGRVVFAETYQAVAPFSTSMASAWLVVEQLRERGWHCQIVVIADDKAEHIVNFYRLDEHLHVEPDIEECADTLPLAICRAALRAKAWEATNG